MSYKNKKYIRYVEKSNNNDINNQYGGNIHSIMDTLVSIHASKKALDTHINTLKTEINKNEKLPIDIKNELVKIIDVLQKVNDPQSIQLLLSKFSDLFSIEQRLIGLEGAIKTLPPH